MDWGERFADVKATTPVQLGPCRCPGTPHPDGDTATVRTSIGKGELKSAYGAGTRYRDDGSGYFDEAAGDDMAIARFTTSWSLVDGKGKPIPIDHRVAALLDEATREALLKPINEAVNRLGGSLPNVPDEESQGSSSETTSKPRRTTTR